MEVFASFIVTGLLNVKRPCNECCHWFAYLTKIEHRFGQSSQQWFDDLINTACCATVEAGGMEARLTNAPKAPRGEFAFDVLRNEAFGFDYLRVDVNLDSNP